MKSTNNTPPNRKETILSQEARLDLGGRKMPRQPPFRDAMNAYKRFMEEEARFSPMTIYQYGRGIAQCQEIVGGEWINPATLTEQDLKELLRRLPSSSKRQEFLWSSYGGFLKFCGNPAIHRIRVRWPTSAKRNVDWLTPEQAFELRGFALTNPLYGILVHLEMDLCLRRIELQRLKLKDIHDETLDVLGKGRYGGKPRTVSLVPMESKAIIANYLEYRKKRWGDGKPDDRLIPVATTTFDAYLEALMKDSGINFKGHHTLRRTGGRLMWLAKVPIETIASVMGHESTTMTLRYIGVSISDQVSAFEAVKRFRTEISQ